MNRYHVPAFFMIQAESKEAAQQEVMNFIEYGLDTGNELGTVLTAYVGRTDEIVDKGKES